MDRKLPPKSEVFVLRVGGQEVWKVRWRGQITTPEWTQRGPADAYLSLLAKGLRKPEVARG